MNFTIINDHYHIIYAIFCIESEKHICHTHFYKGIL